MELDGELQQCPPANSRFFQCRRCFNTSCTFSKLIISCKCQGVSAIHERCFIEEIKSHLQLTSQSIAYQGYDEFRCGKCNQYVLYRPNFSASCIPCSSYTDNEHSIWISFVLIYIVYLGVIGFFIYLAVDSPLMGLYIALIILFFLLTIYFIWIHKKALQATFYASMKQVSIFSAQNLRQS